MPNNTTLVRPRSLICSISICHDDHSSCADCSHAPGVTLMDSFQLPPYAVRPFDHQGSSMQIWACAGCDQTLDFDNVLCAGCGTLLGFLPEDLRLIALAPGQGEGLWRPLDRPDGPRYRHCGNRIEHEACNWMVAEDDPEALCRACRLNRTIPDLDVGDNLQHWKRLEREKRRLVYGLLRLGLPVVDKRQDPDHGLAFDFLADPAPQFREGPGVTTGHAGGLITLNVAEADHVVRENMRQEMAEPYRTILGHFRHESGHYYWDRLVRDSHWLGPVRGLFGDDRQDYGEALGRHYDQGPPSDWEATFVSRYASSHPWEDWAESWAHYLHIVDTLETAWQFGMRLEPRLEIADTMTVRTARDPCRDMPFDAIINAWLPLTHALNNLNRSMGQRDAYPFVLAEPALDKLRQVHEVIRGSVSSR